MITFITCYAAYHFVLSIGIVVGGISVGAHKNQEPEVLSKEEPINVPDAIDDWDQRWKERQ